VIQLTTSAVLVAAKQKTRHVYHYLLYFPFYSFFLACSELFSFLLFPYEQKPEIYWRGPIPIFFYYQIFGRPLEGAYISITNLLSLLSIKTIIEKNKASIFFLVGSPAVS